MSCFTSVFFPRIECKRVWNCSTRSATTSGSATLRSSSSSTRRISSRRRSCAPPSPSASLSMQVKITQFLSIFDVIVLIFCDWFSTKFLPGTVFYESYVGGGKVMRYILELTKVKIKMKSTDKIYKPPKFLILICNTGPYIVCQPGWLHNLMWSLVNWQGVNKQMIIHFNRRKNKKDNNFQ